MSYNSIRKKAMAFDKRVKKAKRKYPKSVKKQALYIGTKKGKVKKYKSLVDYMRKKGFDVDVRIPYKRQMKNHYPRYKQYKKVSYKTSSGKRKTEYVTFKRRKKTSPGFNRLLGF